MEWTDEAIVLAVRRHGESSGILEALTRKPWPSSWFGSRRGFGEGQSGASTRQSDKADLAGLVVRTSRFLSQRSLVRARANDMFERRGALDGLNAFAAIASATLPEREPHAAASYESADILLDTIAEHEFSGLAPLFVRWELGLLHELGSGLDLSRCASNRFAR